VFCEGFGVFFGGFRSKVEQVFYVINQRLGSV